MKLINKTQRVYLTLVVVLLIVWSGIFFVAIYSAIEENINETLRSELIAMVNQSEVQHSIRPIATQQMEIYAISIIRDTVISLSDTTLFNSVEQEAFPYRQASTQVRLEEGAYQITLRRSMVEYDDLFEAILVMEFFFVLLLLAGLFIINKKILRRLWGPFYHSLQQVTDYKIGQPNEIKWKATEIDEFQQLNEVLEDMIHQIEREYQSLKQFTENASHELQTPLSVISSKIEILLQDESLNSEQWQNINTIHETIGKLSRLNKALLMLTKIENEQFDKSEEINLSILLENLIPDYQTLAQSKNITIYKHFKSNICVNMNAELAELMVRNLLGNAIKHNVEDGYVKLNFDKKQLEICNTGNVPLQAPAKWFDRFQKGPNSTDSLGLGLSIVSAIAMANDFDLDYRIEKDIHVIEVGFS